MATSVTYVANQYSVPAYNDTGYAQGAGNLSSYLVALATGSLTLSGGSFPLTADANFGTNFGLKALYYKSSAATVASAGVVRMSNTDLIEWLNFGGAGNNTLGTDTSDRLVYNGAIITPSGGAFTGTHITLTDTTNQIILGTTNTTTINSVAPAASRVYTVPDAGGAASFLLTVGAATITGAKTFASSALLLQENGGTDVATIAVASLATGRTYTVPDAGGAADFLMTVGAQTITGAKTFASSALLLQETGGTDVATIAVASLGAGRTYTVPDAGAAADFLMTVGAQTITGAKTYASSALLLQEAGSTDVVTVAVATLAAGRTYTVPDALASASFVMTTGVSNNSYIVTNWASYTPTLTGVGTATGVSFYWRQVGNEVFVKGYFTMGTVSGSTLSATLPNSFAIATSSMPSNTALIGFATELHTGANAVATAAERKMVFTDGSSTTLVFWSSVIGSGLHQKQTGTQDGATNTPLSIEFSFAI